MSKHRLPDEHRLVSPSNSGGLFEVFRERYLLKLLVRREISARYKGSFFGLAWSYIQPGIRFAIFYFVIGVIMGLRDIEQFGIHMFAGFVLVHYFTETMGAGTRSIVRNRGMVQKLAMPRELFPMASMLVSLYHTIPPLVILTVACLAVGWTPDLVGLGAAGLGFAIAMSFGTAVALVCSAANVYFRDFGKLVSTVGQVITFSVPMIYPFSMVHERFGSAAQYYLYNPMAEAVLLFQRFFWIGTTKDPEQTAAEHLPDHLFTRGFIMLGIGVLCVVLAQMMFSRLDKRIPEQL